MAWKYFIVASLPQNLLTLGPKAIEINQNTNVNMGKTQLFSLPQLLIIVDSPQPDTNFGRILIKNL